MSSTVAATQPALIRRHSVPAADYSHITPTQRGAERKEEWKRSRASAGEDEALLRRDLMFIRRLNIFVIYLSFTLKKHVEQLHVSTHTHTLTQTHTVTNRHTHTETHAHTQ